MVQLFAGTWGFFSDVSFHYSCCCCCPYILFKGIKLQTELAWNLFTTNDTYNILSVKFNYWSTDLGHIINICVTAISKHVPITICVHLCLSGYYCPMGSSVSTQIICPIGQHCPIGIPAPLDCPPGTYSNAEGWEECIPCPEGKGEMRINIHKCMHISCILFWVSVMLITWSFTVAWD